MQEVQLDRAIGRRRYPLTCPFREREGVAGERKLRVSCGPVATFNPSKQEAKGGSDEAQDSIVLSMSNELLYLVPELHTHATNRIEQPLPHLSLHLRPWTALMAVTRVWPATMDPAQPYSPMNL